LHYINRLKTSVFLKFVYRQKLSIKIYMLMMINCSNKKNKTNSQITNKSNHKCRHRPRQWSTWMYQCLFIMTITFTMQRFNCIKNCNNTYSTYKQIVSTWTDLLWRKLSTNYFDIFFLDLPVTKNNRDDIIAQTRCRLGWAFLSINNCDGLWHGSSE
jgi:hypothetical protein